MYTLYDQLRKLREQKGFTQSEVAERLFITRQTVSNWETGKTEPDLDSLGKLCELYGVPVCSVIGQGPEGGAGCVPENAVRPQERKNALLRAAIWSAAVLALLMIRIDMQAAYFRAQASVFGIKLDINDSAAQALLIYQMLRPILFWLTAVMCVGSLIQMGVRINLPRGLRIGCGAAAALILLWLAAEFLSGLLNGSWIFQQALWFAVRYPFLPGAAAALAFLGAASQKSRVPKEHKRARGI